VAKESKKVLGRGLSVLLKDDSTKEISKRQNVNNVVGNIIEIEIDNIELNPFQPRKKFKEETIKELASSIKELGVIQPITVRKLKEKNKYEIISGERRYRASKIVGLNTIPSFIRLANDQESLEMALVENVQREDLDPIEIAMCYERLINEIKLTQEQLSERVGKKRPTITNYLRLLKLDPIIQSGIRDGFISMGHGRALINLENKVAQLGIYEKIINSDLSVRKTESLVKKSKTSHKNKNVIAKPIDVFDNEIKELQSFFNSNVKIKKMKNGKGEIIISFSSSDDFKRIKNILKK